MVRKPMSDEEDEDVELEVDDEYRPLDFDNNSHFDRREQPDLTDYLNKVLDDLEDEEAKDELDLEEQAIEESLDAMEEE